jgi:hypothetical protein
MKVTVKKPVEIDVKTVRLSVAVRYDEEDMPNDFPFRKNDIWEVTIDIETGKIRDWPEGVTHALHMKVCDQGSYWLYDAEGGLAGWIDEDYVPNELIPGSYGDYIEMDIRADGTIANWPTKPDVSAFFPQD